MTHEEVLAQMEADYKIMTPEVRETVLFNGEGKDWTPTMLIEEVRSGSEVGHRYTNNWAMSVEEEELLSKLKDILFGDGPLPTCGDPACTTCQGSEDVPELPPPSQRH